MSVLIPFAEDSRQPLASTEIDFGSYRCHNIQLLSTSGSSGLVYQATSDNYFDENGSPVASLIVKECYPLELSERISRDGDRLSFKTGTTEDELRLFDRYLNRYRKAFENNALLMRSGAREQVSMPSRAFSANGTLYIVNNASHGIVMSKAFKSMSLYQRIKTLIRLCETIAAIHDVGYLYLDLKPDNILCVLNPARPQDFTDEIRLFDFDSMTARSEVGNPNTVISGSGNWSSFEQTHPGHLSEIGPASDIYAIGAMLFWITIGRPPTTNEVIHAGGNWQIREKDLININISNLPSDFITHVRNIFNRTLCVDPSLRLQSARELASELETLGELVMPENNAIAKRLEQLEQKLDAINSQALHAATQDTSPATIKLTPRLDTDGSSANESTVGANDCESQILERSISSAFIAIQALSTLRPDVPLSEAANNRIDEIINSLKTSLDNRNIEETIGVGERAATICNALMAMITLSAFCDAASDECESTLLSISEKLDAAIACMNLDAIDEICQHLDASNNALRAIFVLSTFLDKSSFPYLSDGLRLEAENLIREVNAALADTTKIDFDQENCRIEEMSHRISEDIQLGMLRGLF